MTIPTLDDVERQYGIAWRFDTARYTVALWAEDEDIPPEDAFEFAEDIEAIRSGRVLYFCALVGVFDEHGDCLGMDTLGCCSYYSMRDFRAAGGYFPSMVREAVRQARVEVAMAGELGLTGRDPSYSTWTEAR